MPFKKKDISTFIGKKFNRLTILEDIGVSNGRTRVKAICKCGVIKEYFFYSIESGGTKSCGCLNLEKASERLSTHGLSKHPLYRIWKGMISRCYNKNRKSYADYGAKGVTVSTRWRNNFKAFYDWAIDKWKPGLQLDKDIRSDGKTGSLYCPELCCFVTPKQNGRKKINNIIINHDGKYACVSEWSEITGIMDSTIRARFHKGWDTNRILDKVI